MIHIQQITEYLTQFVVDVKTDLVLISEEYRNKDPASWYPNLSSTTSISQAACVEGHHFGHEAMNPESINKSKARNWQNKGNRDSWGLCH